MLKYVFRALKKGVLKIKALWRNKDSQIPFSIYPSTDFRKYISNDPNRIMKKAWERTGKQMYDAIDQVSKDIGVNGIEKRKK